MQFLSLSSSPFAAWLECLSGDFGRKKRGRRRRKEGREVFVHPSPPLYPRPDPQSLRRTRQDNSSYPISNRKSSAVRGKKKLRSQSAAVAARLASKAKKQPFLLSAYCMISGKNSLVITARRNTSPSPLLAQISKSWCGGEAVICARSSWL